MSPLEPETILLKALLRTHPEYLLKPGESDSLMRPIMMCQSHHKISRICWIMRIPLMKQYCQFWKP